MMKRTLETIAKEQCGYFTAQQAIRAGYAHHNHVYHTKKGNWLWIARGLFRLPGYPDTLESSFARWSFWAIGRSPGRRVVISHDSALHFYRLSPHQPSEVHLTVPDRQFLRDGHDECICHRQGLADVEIVHHASFLITTPLRTLQDMKPDLILTGCWGETVRQALAQNQLSEQSAEELRAATLRLLDPSAPKHKIPAFAPASPGCCPSTAAMAENFLEGQRMTEELSPLRQRSGEWRMPNRSFTLIEMLVVVAIIAILFGLLQPALMTAVAQAKGTRCTNNLRHIGTCIANYASDNNNWLPAVYTGGWFWFQTFPVFYITGKDINAGYLWLNSTIYGVTSESVRSDWVTVCPSANPLRNNGNYGLSASFFAIPMWNYRYHKYNELTAPSGGGFVLDVIYSGANLNAMEQYVTGYGWTNSDYRHNGKMNILMGDNHVAPRFDPLPSAATDVFWTGRR